MLEEADVGMAGQMTNIGKAIVKGIEMFEQDTVKTKVMLLLTDGVDAGTDILPLDAADLAKNDSVTQHDWLPLKCNCAPKYGSTI